MKKTFLYSLIMIVSIFTFQGCSKEKDSDGLVKISVTLEPQAFVVESIAGSKASVHTLISGNSDPHTYDPDIKSIMTLVSSDIYFTAGLMIEEKITQKVLESKNPPAIVLMANPEDAVSKVFHHSHSSEFLDKVDASDEHDKHEDHENLEDFHLNKTGYVLNHELDPHLWLSMSGLISYGRIVKNTLIEIDSNNTAFYEDNFKKFVEEVTNTFNEAAQQCSNLSFKKILVYHPSYTYLFNVFGLSQVPVQAGGTSPDIRKMNSILLDIQNGKLPAAVIVQPQYDAGSVDIIVEKTGAQIFVIDSLFKNPLETVAKAALIFKEINMGSNGNE